MSQPHSPQEVGESIFYVLAVKAPDAVMQIGTHRVVTRLAGARDALAALSDSLVDRQEYIVVEDAMVDIDTHTLESSRFIARKAYDFEPLS